MDVHILVLDVQTRRPLPTATVVLFDGPTHPLEMPAEALEEIEFGPDAEHANAQQAATNEEGEAVFSRRFKAHGTRDKFRDLGFVETYRVWAKISAPDYGTIIIPLSGQDSQLRDINNKSPILLTVMLSRDASLP